MLSNLHTKKVKRENGITKKKIFLGTFMDNLYRKLRGYFTMLTESVDTKICDSNNATSEECIVEKSTASLNIDATTEALTVISKESEITQGEQDKAMEEDLHEEVPIVSKSTSPILSNEEIITTNNDEQPVDTTMTIGEQATEIIEKDDNTLLSVNDELGQAADDPTILLSSPLQAMGAETPNDHEKDKDVSITTKGSKKREYDAYSGYDQPSPKKKNKRSRKKGKKSDSNNDNNIVLEQSEIYNNIIVRYTPNDLPESLIK